MHVGTGPMVRGVKRYVWGTVVVALSACSSGGGLFASPVAGMTGCYALEFGPWPADMAERGLPDPASLPQVFELTEATLGRTELESVDGRLHEVRVHARGPRTLLHQWRLLDGDVAIVETSGPVGFTVEYTKRGDKVSGTVTARSEEAAPVEAPLTGLVVPCPRALPVVRPSV